MATTFMATFENEDSGAPKYDEVLCCRAAASPQTSEDVPEVTAFPSNQVN